MTRKDQYVLRVIQEPAFPWESQVVQYQQEDDPGIHYFGGETPDGIVDCLLFYNEDRRLVGILNHYGFYESSGLEKPGNINIFVDPAQRKKGIATALLDESRKRWLFDIEEQTYTLEGAAFIKKYFLSHDDF